MRKNTHTGWGIHNKLDSFQYDVRMEREAYVSDSWAECAGLECRSYYMELPVGHGSMGEQVKSTGSVYDELL